MTTRFRETNFYTWEGAKATVQPSRFGAHSREDRPTLPEPIVAMAEAEYERQFPGGQTAVRLRERGGLGLGELVCLLANAVERYAPADELTPFSRRP